MFYREIIKKAIRKSNQENPDILFFLKNTRYRLHNIDHLPDDLVENVGITNPFDHVICRNSSMDRPLMASAISNT